MRICLVFPYSETIFELFSSKFLLNTYSKNDSYILIYNSMLRLPNKKISEIYRIISWSTSKDIPTNTIEEAQEIVAMYDLIDALKNPDLFCEWFEQRFGEVT